MKMRSGLLTLLTALLILPNISHAADPLLVDAVGTATNGNDTPSDPALNGFIVYLPQPTLAGNAVICGVTYPYSSSRTLSITDDKSDTWTKAVSVNNTNGNSEAIYYSTNVPAGMDKITFTFNAAILGFQVACKEAYNIVSSSPVNGTSAASGLSGPTISAGALTTTASSDLIFQYGDYDSGTLSLGSQTATGYTDGSGWSRIIADTETGEFFQDVLQSSAGSITPSYSISGASNSTFGTVAAAFKTSSSAGTLPPSSGIHIDHEWTVDLGLATAFKATFPTDGDFTSIAITNAAWTGYKVSDSLSNIYTQSAPAYEGGVIGRLFYAVNPNVSLDQTITLNNNSGGNTEYVIRDIRGVATSSPLDTATAVAIQQTNFNNGSTISGGTITPSQPNELIILAQVNGEGPPLGVTSPSGVITDNVWAPSETDADWFDLGEGHAHYFATGTSAISFTWTMENNVSATSGGGNSAGTALWAIKAASAPAITYGDLNGAANGAVTIYDAELVAQYVVGLITLTPAQIQEAEVSSTTETAPTIYDAFLIAEYSVGLITQFPVQ